MKARELSQDKDPKQLAIARYKEMQSHISDLQREVKTLKEQREQQNKYQQETNIQLETILAKLGLKEGSVFRQQLLALR